MKQLTIKDLMTIGVYAALYFLFVGLGTLIGVLLIHSGNMTYAPVFAALLCGTVYMLLIAKVRKFGAIFLVGAVMAIFFFLSGHFILSFVPSLLFGFLGDMVAKLGDYRKPLTNLLSYVVFSFGNLGPIILMWFMKEAYINRLLEKGKDMTYISNVMVDFTVGNVLWLFGLIAIAGLAGGLFGQFLVKKHFAKAGMVRL